MAASYVVMNAVKPVKVWRGGTRLIGGDSILALKLFSQVVYDFADLFEGDFDFLRR
jgi:hypothetical protein